MNAIKFPPSFFECRNATLAARARLNDKTIGTRVQHDGKVQVVRVEYPKARGFAKVTPLSEYLHVYDAIAFLNGLQ